MQSILKSLRWRLSILIVVLTLVLQPKLVASDNTDVANQQQMTITGTVTDGNTGEAIPGVSIAIKGTTTGTITNIDGLYSITVNEGEVLLYSFIGYLDEEVTVGTTTTIDVALIVDIVGLDEVVVVGYGTQKKKLNTGATVNVKGEELAKQNTATPMDALKGMSAGVTITSNSGAPGAGTKVTIRGTGTIGNSEPLYVVDGVQVGDIDYLAPSDIASIDVLKDAASTAIYGSAAANGVILVSTKKGTQSAKPSVSYDAYYGWQRMINDPQMANAQDYMKMVSEADYNDNVYDPSMPYDPASHVMNWDETKVPNLAAYQDGSNAGTDWLGLIYEENAPVESHAFSVNGGTKASVYSMGVNYFSQTGIIGKGANNKYERLSARLNTQHDIITVNERSVFRLGQNLTFSNSSNPTIANGNNYYNDLKNALVTTPLLPNEGGRYLYDGDYDEENGLNPAYPYHYAIAWNEGQVNPVAVMKQRGQYNENDNNALVGNVFGEIEPIKGLVLRSAYGFNSRFGSSRQWADAYDLGPITPPQTLDRTTQNMYNFYQYTWTNTATYDFNVASAHRFTVLAGHEQTKITKNLSMRTANDSLLVNKWETAYISNTRPTNVTYIDIEGRDDYGYGKMSYFGRLSYDYKETLLATFVYRTDGSTKLAPGHQWKSFYSASLGYVLSNHDAIRNIPGLNYLKLRGGWGQNGNDQIPDFQYAANLTTYGGSYYFGQSKDRTSIGYYAALTPNPLATWETSQQINAGFDANFLANRLQINADWYNKTTKDWLVKSPEPFSGGTDAALKNAGSVSNKGVELAVKWIESRGNFSYSIGGNIAYNKNEVTELDAIGGQILGNPNVLKHGHPPMQVVEPGMPIGYFYGFETDGVLQNQADVDAYVIPDSLSSSGEPVPYFPNQQPGDIRFVDQNGDGKFDDEDKKLIGNPTPDITYGFNFSIDYKGLYASLNASGMAGHQVVMMYTPGNKDNYTQNEIDSRWHGEGTSNTNPRLTLSNHRNYNYMSDYYVHDADFLRISNVTIGYDFNKLMKNSPLQQLRLYVSGQNLLTVTKYKGMDPEVGYGGDVPWGRGVDLGLYPAARTFMVGLSAKF